MFIFIVLVVSIIIGVCLDDGTAIVLDDLHCLTTCGVGDHRCARHFLMACGVTHAAATTTS